MYEIHINSSKIILIKTSFAESVKKDETSIVARYQGKRKTLLNYIDKAEKSNEGCTIIICSPYLHTLKTDFFSLYKIIKAAGGLVLNGKGEALLIFRRGYWDLPKGKKEKKEKRKETAIREIKEETGIENLHVLYPLPTTYHTYKIDKQRILKQSYWYLMESDDENLVPQTDEDIDRVEWVSMERIRNGEMRPVFPSIERLLQHFIRE